MMRTPMLAIALFSVLLLSVSSTTIPFERIPNQNGVGSSFLVKASNLKNVPINSTKEVGFYVNVDLANGPNPVELSVGDVTPSYVAMIIALYTSDTLLSSDCKSFHKYDCEKYKCKESQDTVTANFPFFTAEGHAITADMTLEKGSWILDSQAIWATKCTGNTIANFGLGTHGLIGLGIENLKNYRKKDIDFSIFLKQDITKGELIFSKDFSKALSETPVATFPANNDWHVEVESKVEIGTKILSKKGTKTIFDLHSDVTGFPKTLFADVLNALTQKQENVTFTCPKVEDSYYLPVCTYTGEPEFGDITIIVGDQKLIIPPEIYVSYPKAETPSVKFNIRALGSTLEKSENFVTPSYDNYIILDSSVLSYYYTVFEAGAEAGKNTISFYVANHDAEKSNSLIAYIILGIFIVLLIFFAFLTYSSYLKKQKARDGLFTNSSLFDNTKRMDRSLASSTGYQNYQNN